MKLSPPDIGSAVTTYSLPHGNVDPADPCLQCFATVTGFYEMDGVGWVKLNTGWAHSMDTENVYWFRGSITLNEDQIQNALADRVALVLRQSR